MGIQLSGVWVTWATRTDLDRIRTALIATTTTAVPVLSPRDTRTTFQRSTVLVNGVQAVLPGTLPNLIVRNNRFSGSDDRVVMLADGQPGAGRSATP